jgi:hypothetical protein
MLKRMPAGLGGEDAGEAQRRSYLTNLIGIRNAVKVTKILCDRLNLWQPKLVVLLAEATFAAICLPGGPPRRRNTRTYASSTASQATSREWNKNQMSIIFDYTVERAALVY